MTSKAHPERLARYAAARRNLNLAEQSLVATIAAGIQARQSLAEALTRSDQHATAGLKAQVNALAAREMDERRRRKAQLQEAYRARTAALGGSAGFALLSGKHPLLLLPVRLEARFAWLDGTKLTFVANPALEHVLLVRVYPDEIHEDSHEPELAPDETDALVDFYRKLTAARDSQALRAAWQELAARVGPNRAAWIGEVAITRTRPGTRSTRYARPTTARLLPDRWVAVAELDDGSRLTAMSRPVVEPLEIGPSPDGVAWMTDFGAAERVGMALIIRNLPADTVRVAKLRVVGALGTLNPSDTQAEFEKLLRAHQFTRGLELLTPGTPTNSLPGARAAYTSRPSVAEIVEVNQRRYLVGGAANPLCHLGDHTDGAALAFMLGVNTTTFAYVKGADATWGRAGACMRMLLAAATKRTLGRNLADAVAPALLDEILEYGTARVSALGAVPTLRVGSQPYGMLPILRRDTSRMASGSNAARYMPLLEKLRSRWETAETATEYVGKRGADPGRTLIRMLQLDGITQRVAFRPFISREIGGRLATTWTATQTTDLAGRRAGTVRLLRSLGIPTSTQSPLVLALHLGFAPSLTAPLVQSPDVATGSPQAAANYLELLASTRVDALYRNEYPNGVRPLALLFAIARLAVLEKADERARELLIASGASPRHWDDEDLPNQFVDYYASMQRRLEAQDPIDPTEPIAFHLSEQGRDAYVLASLRQCLRDLKLRPPELLDELLRASLCLFTSRLDAWYTALAAHEIENLRQDPKQSSGLHVGAYGILDQITRQPLSSSAVPGVYTSSTNGGYIHAPSVNQGAAAAVLRSVHLAHAAQGHGEAFSVDLSSARVRSGLRLVEGIRAGQPMAALLGYQVERDLLSEGIPQLIAPLRSLAPLLANGLTPSNLPTESVAASNVVDGLTLLAEAGYDGQQHASVGALLTRYPALASQFAPGQTSALQRVLLAAEAALDAVSDLVVAESVYQIVQGNAVRAGATLDSLSGAPVPLPDFSILKTPRPGIGLAHRVLILLGDATDGDSGWGETPRSRAEPRVEAWARTVLPRPEQIRLRARFVDAQGSVQVAEIAAASLKDLMRASQPAAPHLAIAALDIVAVANPGDTPQRSALELRLLALLETLRPPNAADATCELLFDRAADWDEKTFGIAETFEVGKLLRDLLNKARPLAPADLASVGNAEDFIPNTADLASRSTVAAQALAEVTTKLELAAQATSAELRAALFSADAIGIAGAAPISLRDVSDEKDRKSDLERLRQQAQMALREVSRRAQVLSETATDDYVARIKAVFGDGFITLPTLLPASSISDLFAPSAAPADADGPAVRAWLGRAARVRENVRALDETLFGSEIVAQTLPTPPLQFLRVAQLGAAPGERWAALPLPKDTAMPGGRVSLVAVAWGQIPTTVVAGLLVDEWVETVPSATQTTSVAFHCDTPTSAPPQVLLVGVPYPNQETWTSDDVIEIVEEALSLARIRMVDGDALPELGQLLPAFISAENVAGETAGLDVERLTTLGQ
jgi:hypothetical protein